MSKLKAEEIARGIKVALDQLKLDLRKDIGDMSTKQLRRMLEITVNVLAFDEDEMDRAIAAYTTTEQRYIGQLVALIKNSNAFHVYEVSQLEKQKQTIESEQKGEGNEE